MILSVWKISSEIFFEIGYRVSSPPPDLTPLYLSPTPAELLGKLRWGSGYTNQEDFHQLMMERGVKSASGEFIP